MQEKCLKKYTFYGKSRFAAQLKMTRSDFTHYNVVKRTENIVTLRSTWANNKHQQTARFNMKIHCYVFLVVPIIIKYVEETMTTQFRIVD